MDYMQEDWCHSRSLISFSLNNNHNLNQINIFEKKFFRDLKEDAQFLHLYNQPWVLDEPSLNFPGSLKKY